MLLKKTNKQVISIIKLLSTVLIVSAIGLDIWNLCAAFTNQVIPSSLHPILWVGNFVVVIHFIEGIIAAFYASSTRQIPIQYGAYTFFVGTVGLLELFEEN
ncbi:MAG: hypothetical protein F6J89_11945 [Symploca sp. SIO1C4]|uniref:Uncharacterized protein n=1 Tax=Symploca sp. SIO1C4 TaxID=2607765 RepID=A0A6B3N9H8_9CYAN|nr:hypothetical protein [Symploca sp. SIO1C4]NET03502.1 hypothetical protein [Symploca sp. SIO2B6]NET51063.1 hypothetical protein [Merismopedia sp. SIO2A8]